MTMVQEFQKKKKKEKKEETNRVLESARKLFDGRDDIIDLFEKGTFPYKGNVFKIEKLKNEIRQILYSLYRSKKLLKQLYKSLTDII